MAHGSRRNGEANETTIRLRIEELGEGGYVATSPDVPGLVAGFLPIGYFFGWGWGATLVIGCLFPGAIRKTNGSGRA